MPERGFAAGKIKLPHAAEAVVVELFPPPGEFVPLAERSRDEVVAYARLLWGYDVRLESVDQSTGQPLCEVGT